MRAWPPHTGPEGRTYSENFASLNRNKRSAALDLKNPDDVAMARAYAAAADIVVENNRPGVLDRLGLGYAALSALNPKLVYCSISAYGQTGPRAQEGGFDVTIQAISGIMSVTGEDGGEPVKAGVPISDFAAGLYGAFTILAQVRRAAETGKGVHIDVPMMGTSLAVAALQASEYFGSHKDPVKLGSAHPRNAPYQAFRARDTHFVMAAGTQALWLAACRELRRDDLATDPRFATTMLRAKNQIALKDALEQTFAGYDAADLIERLSRAGVPCVPINRYSAAVTDPQTVHEGWVVPITLPNGIETRSMGFPVKFDGLAPAVRLAPPELGQQ